MSDLILPSGDGRLIDTSSILTNKFRNLKFKLRLNPEVPRGKIGVTEGAHPGEFYLLSREDVPDSVILKAIAAWVVKHGDAIGLDA